MRFSDKELNKYYRYALALTHQSDEAYDLVHDALIKIQGRLLFKREAYVKTTIRNLFYSSLRKKEKQHEELTDDPAEDVSLEEIVGNQFEVEKLLAELSEEDRELLYLIEVEEYSYKEAAQLLNKSLGTLQSKLFRCKKRLKERSLK